MPLTLHYISHWNVNTGVPVLVDGIGTVGDTYKVTCNQSEAPNLIVQYDFGSGDVSCIIGLFIVYNGTNWISVITV